MSPFIEHILKLDDKTLRKLANKARMKARYSKNSQHKQNRLLLAECCELELKLRHG